MFQPHSATVPGDQRDYWPLHKVREHNKLKFGDVMIFLFFKVWISRARREERATVKDLLADEFFNPEDLAGIRVDIKNRDADLTDMNVEVRHLQPYSE